MPVDFILGSNVIVKNDTIDSKNSSQKAKNSIDDDDDTDKILKRKLSIDKVHFSNSVKIPKLSSCIDSYSRIDGLIGDSIGGIDLLLLKKISIERNGAFINKSLLTDGKEYIEFVEWNINSFNNYMENTTLRFTNYFVKIARSGNQYFIQMNKNNFIMLPQEQSELVISEINVPLPKHLTFDDLVSFKESSLISCLSFYVLEISHTFITIKQRQRKLTKISAVSGDCSKSINIELWDLNSIIELYDKCSIKFAQLKVAPKMIITNSDYYLIEIMEHNCELPNINKPYSLTIESKSNKYTSNKTFADSKDLTATIEGILKYADLLKNAITIDLEDDLGETVRVTFWSNTNLMPLLSFSSLTECYLELKKILMSKIQITALKKEIKSSNGTIVKYFNGLTLNLI